MYANQISCPECGEKISPRETRCDCGWSKKKENATKDHRCIFELNGKRCLLPGTMSNSTQKTNDWRCSYHFEAMGDFEKSKKWMEFIEKNFQEIIHFRKHYQTNFKNCERCQKLCGAEKDFSKTLTETSNLDFYDLPARVA